MDENQSESLDDLVTQGFILAKNYVETVVSKKSGFRGINSGVATLTKDLELLQKGYRVSTEQIQPDSEVLNDITQTGGVAVRPLVHVSIANIAIISYFSQKFAAQGMAKNRR